MFHCNGWCFPWSMAAVAGVNVCLRRVEGPAMLEAIRAHGVTHMCGAPIVYSMLVDAVTASGEPLPRTVRGQIAASAPPPALIEGCERAGIELTHVYGLTETYGPASVCAPQEEWSELSLADRAERLSRQGVRATLQEGMTVLDPETMQPVPADGHTMGEIFFRGNITMKGYLKNPETTAKSFAGGWFHTGDLAVLHPDGYAKIQDRSKDIIISGGENISSLEVEEALYRHPAVMHAAVVAQPDAKWGEVPCAVVELRPGMAATEPEIIEFCRARMARFKVPKRVLFREVPKTSTGKIQKHVLRARCRKPPGERAVRAAAPAGARGGPGPARVSGGGADQRARHVGRRGLRAGRGDRPGARPAAAAAQRAGGDPSRAGREPGGLSAHAGLHPHPAADRRARAAAEPRARTWRLQRRTTAPALAPRILPLLAPHMAACASRRRCRGCARAGRRAGQPAGRHAGAGARRRGAVDVLAGDARSSARPCASCSAEFGQRMARPAASARPGAAALVALAARSRRAGASAVAGWR